MFYHINQDHKNYEQPHSLHSTTMFFWTKIHKANMLTKRGIYGLEVLMKIELKSK
jgi:hypothetical protein